MTTTSTGFEAYKKEIIERQRQELANVENDYAQGMNDCKAGQYDKWYRYHRKDDGRAYDLGWMRQNETTQVETVKFLDA